MPESAVMKKRHFRAIKYPHRESDMEDSEPTDEQRKRYNIEIGICQALMLGFTVV